MKLSRKLRWLLLYALLSLLTCWLLWDSSLIESYELKSYDWRLMAQAPKSRDPRIVLVSIGDESLKKMKRLKGHRERSRWPWPSTNYAAAIENCFEKGAAVVGVDLLTFDSPSAPKYRFEDEILARLCREYSGRVVLAQRYDIIAADGVEREEWSLPMKPLREHCRRGYINVIVSPDGVVRKFRPEKKRMYMFSERAFSLEILDAYAKYCAKAPSGEGGGSRGARESAQDRVYAGPWSIRRSSQGQSLIEFCKDPWEKRMIPYWQVLEDEGLDERVFEGAIVLIGPTALEFHDRHPTPVMTVSRRASQGVSIQADIINSFLMGSNLHRVKEELNHRVALLAAFLAFVIASFAGALWGPIVLFFGVWAYWHWLCVLMEESGAWMDFARPLLLVIAVCFVVTLARLVGEERRRRQVRKMFSAYVSREVLKYLELNPEAFSLRGERRDVTVFFSDVEGFTGLSETVSPDVLASILNRYFTPMSELLMAEGGYVDKYIGDAIMGVFGVPQVLEHHPRRACRAALKQMEALEGLNDSLEEEFGKCLSIRIGLNSGMVSAGNMGSASRFEYTVMGDAVNLASRLEGANKIYGTRIMCGPKTFERAREDFDFRFLDLLRVKGKEEPVRVFELLGEKGELSEEEQESYREFERAWKLYSEGSWSEAKDVFRAVDEARGGDGPSRLYMERCRIYEASPPPEDWQGVFVMKSK